MPQEDSVAPATPAERRRRRSRGLAVLALFILVVFCGLAATVLAVNGGRNYKRLVHQAGMESYLLPKPAPPKLRIDRQRRLAPGPRYPQALLRPSAPEIARLIRPAPASAESRCDNLRVKGGEEPKFTEQGHEWECTWLDQLSDATEPASIFVQAKGISDDLRTFRIKLSFTEPGKEEAIEQRALSAIDRFDLSLSPASRDYLAGRIDARKPFRSSLETYRAMLSQEMLDTRRFNLLLLSQDMSAPCPEQTGPEQIDPEQTHPTDSAGSRIRSPASIGCLALAEDRPFSLPL